MKASEVLERLMSLRDSQPERFAAMEFVVGTDDPSVGPSAVVSVENLNPGFDWDSGKLIIQTSPDVIRKPAKTNRCVLNKNKKSFKFDGIEFKSQSFGRGAPEGHAPYDIERRAAVMEIVEKINGK